MKNKCPILDCPPFMDLLLTYKESNPGIRLQHSFLTMGKCNSTFMSFLPWLTLAAVIWLQSLNGTNSDFSEYSSHLKSRLAVTQLQLTYLAVASDVGKLFAWISGIAAQRLPLPFILIIGAVIGIVGYGIPFLFLAGKIATLTYWQALLLAMMAGNSICWVNTACYVASMRTFPADHSTVMGLATSYSALSAKIYIALAHIIKTQLANKSIYLLLNSVTPLVAGGVLAPLLIENIPSTVADGASTSVLFVIACATGAYAVVMTVVPKLRGNSQMVPDIILLLVVAAVAGVPLVKGLCWMLKKRCNPAKVCMTEVVLRVGEGGEEEVVDDGEREHGVKELLVSVNFWLYFWVYLCGGTLGLVYMNNLGQISQSRGVSDSFLLSISSAFGFFGKLASAPLVALKRSKYMVSTPALMSSLMGPMAASFFLLLDPSTSSLFISTAIIGFCSGAMTSIAISMTAELFGRKSFSVNHNILIANIPIGSLMFGYIGGYVYDKEGDLENDVGSCDGLQCYRSSFIIWGFICLYGTILSYVLYYRTRRQVPNVKATKDEEEGDTKSADSIQDLPPVQTKQPRHQRAKSH